LNGSKEWNTLQKQVRELAQNLGEKLNIPHVKAQEPLLLELIGDEWWATASLPSLETLRKSLRDLVKFADQSVRPTIYSDFEDSAVQLTQHNHAPASPLVSDYQRRVRAFIENRRHHPAIMKLHANESLSPAEWQELDDLIFEASGFPNRADFETHYGAQPQLGTLVRSIVGLDRQAAKKAFGEFLNGAQFSSAQMDFIGQVIDLLAQNGTISTDQLFHQPFTLAHPSGASGLFVGHLDHLMGIVGDINANAMH